MKLLEIITGAISKIWNFCVKIIGMGLTMTFVLFGLTVFYPDKVLMAIEIVKGILFGTQ